MAATKSRSIARSSKSWTHYFQTPAARQVMDRSAFLNSLIDERSFPWTKIFMDLEKTLPPGVRVVSISPHLVNGRAEVALQVGVASDESEIQFLQAIEKSPVFSRDRGGSGAPGDAAGYARTKFF